MKKNTLFSALLSASMLTIPTQDTEAGWTSMRKMWNKQNTSQNFPNDAAHATRKAILANERNCRNYGDCRDEQTGSNIKRVTPNTTPLDPKNYNQIQFAPPAGGRRSFEPDEP